MGERKKLYRHPLFLGAGILVVALVIAPKLLVMLLFIGIGAASTIYKSRFNIGLDLELQSFFTIAAGHLYGPAAGMIVGFASVTLAHAINLMFFSNPALSLTYAGSFSVLGLLSAHLPLGMLVVGSIVYLVANDIIFVYLGSILGANPGRLILSAIVHPLFVFAMLSRVLIPFLSISRGVL